LFPELLGMTLYLEYEATPTLTPIVRMLRGRRIDPLFYQLHVAIDNISKGHGAIALQAVKTFLNEQRQQGGEEEVQENWARIWNGYVGWKTIGFFGVDAFMRRLIIDKKRINIGTPAAPKCIPDLATYYKEQMIALVERKAVVARQVHGGVAIGGRPLSSLFDKPEELLELLIEQKLVDPKHPRDSRLFALMQFEGPMYRVFSEEEQSMIMDWIESLKGHAYECLEPLPETPGDDPAAKMAELIVNHASDAKTAHAGITLTTQSGEHKALAELFDNPAELMGALVVSGWVSPGEPDRSFFMTRILQNDGPMDGIFTADEVATVKAWIQAGAETPHDLDRLMGRRMEDLPPEESAARTAAQDFVRQRPMIGMGSVH
jgi:Iron-containing redox enzyme